MNIRHPFKRHKYGVSAKDKRTVDGITFDSKLEMTVYLRLKRDPGVLFMLRQTPFHLPGKTRYVVDFTVFYVDGRVEFIDAKGLLTDTYKMKKRMVEELYSPVRIKEITE